MTGNTCNSLTSSFFFHLERKLNNKYQIIAKIDVQTSHASILLHGCLELSILHFFFQTRNCHQYLISVARRRGSLCHLLSRGAIRRSIIEGRDVKLTIRHNTPSTVPTARSSLIQLFITFINECNVFIVISSICA